MEALTREQLDTMKEVDVRTVDPKELRDIQEVTVRTDLPKKERMLDFVQQIGNPYCYRYEMCVVKVSFSDTDVTLEERIRSYLHAQYG